MDPVAAKYLAAGLACIGVGLSALGIGIVYASIDQAGQKGRPKLGLLFTTGFGLGCFGVALLLLFAL